VSSKHNAGVRTVIVTLDASDAHASSEPLGRTDIVYSSDRKVNLTAQNEYLRKLISDSIDRVLAFIILDNAYPETEGGLVVCASRITHKVAKKLGYTDVLNHMDKELKYWKSLANPVH